MPQFCFLEVWAHLGKHATRAPAMFRTHYHVECRLESGKPSPRPPLCPQTNGSSRVRSETQTIRYSGWSSRLTRDHFFRSTCAYDSLGCFLDDDFVYLVSFFFVGARIQQPTAACAKDTSAQHSCIATTLQTECCKCRVHGSLTPLPLFL